MVNQSKLKALVAVPPETSTQALALFAPDLAITLSTSFAHAKKALEDPFDVIAAATSFEESHMFDLLRYCKADPIIRSIPFIAMRIDGISMDETIHQAIQIATHALGAEGYIDLQRLSGHSHEQDKEFRQIVQMLIQKKRFDV